MELTEHRNIVNQLMGMVAPENQATASELFTQLSEDYEKQSTSLSEVSKSVEDLTKNNETLRSVNAKLFLKVGEQVTGTQDNNNRPNGSDTSENNSEDVPSYDSLFNEKGELM